LDANVRELTIIALVSCFSLGLACSFLAVVKKEVPNISSEALVYLDEAVAAFYAGCLLASCVMLGVAAEAEFLRLVDAAASGAKHGASSSPYRSLRLSVRRSQSLTPFYSQ
jgi:hypothetical protein